MKKKIMALCLVAILAITAIGGATLAYYTDTDDADNVFTVGNVDIKLTEPNWVDEDPDDQIDGQADVYPGEALAKDPTVTNIGKNPCFVRVKVENLDQFDTKGAITLRWIDEQGVYHNDYNTRDWTKIGEYYYYNKVVTYTGDDYNTELTTVTTPVFSQIVMPTGLTGNEAAEPITVTAEAVQAQGAQPSWSAVKAMKPADIAAWFDTVNAAA